MQTHVIRDLRDAFLLLIIGQFFALAGECLVLADAPLPYRISLVAVGALTLIGAVGVSALGVVNLWRVTRRILGRE